MNIWIYIDQQMGGEASEIRNKNRTSLKRQAVHRAGRKMQRGYGWVRNPKKYVYNKIYNRTSFGYF